MECLSDEFILSCRAKSTHTQTLCRLAHWFPRGEDSTVHGNRLFARESSEENESVFNVVSWRVDVCKKEPRLHVVVHRSPDAIAQSKSHARKCRKFLTHSCYLGR